MTPRETFKQAGGTVAPGSTATFPQEVSVSHSRRREGRELAYSDKQLNFLYSMHKNRNRFLFTFLARFLTFPTSLDFYCVVKKECAAVTGFIATVN